jgi:hypothetical protein
METPIVDEDVIVATKNTMSTLNTNEKQILEKLFQMGGGYVLNFSDRTIGEFFRDDVGIDISHQKYNYASGSKANRMRGLWQTADDVLVGKSVEKLIEYIDNQILLGNLKKEDFPAALIEKGRGIGARLTGKKHPQEASRVTEDEFIAREFGAVSVDKLGLDAAICDVLTQRLDEIRRCLGARSSLAVIFLCGSTLEGILLGTASARAKDFNQSAISPKDKTGKVKPFQEWTLNDFINVAQDLNLIGEDVKKFSHALRDFRNYIHPYQQMSSKFNPDSHTARICWQVLQASIAQLSK